MMRSREHGRAAVVVAIVAAVGLGAGAAWYFANSAQGFGPAGPVRTLLPDSAAVYVELRDAGKLWDSVSSSEAATDFATSRARREILDSAPIKDTLALVTDVASRAKFEMNATNAKKLFGREIGIAVVPRSGSERPDWAVVSKIDVAALTKDLVAGDADFSKLHEAIDARTGLCEFGVARTAHRGIAISRATKGTTAFSFALLGDALVLSPNAALVTKCVDAHLDAGKGSLARVPAFAADVARVPASAPIVEWYDLDRMREGRASISAGIDSLRSGTRSAAAVDHVLDSARDIRTIARATEIPGGNPYDMTWSWSLASGGDAAAARPLSEILLPDAPVFAEFRGTAQLIAAWDRSAIARKLGTGLVGQKFDAFLVDPVKFGRSLGLDSGLAALGGVGDLDEDDWPAEPSDGEDPPAKTEEPPFGAFEVRTGLRFTRRVIEEMAGSSIGVAVLPHEGGDDADVVLATQVSAGTRLVLLASEGAALAGGRCRVEQHGERRIIVVPGGASDPRELAIAHVAGHVVVANSADHARRAIDAFVAPAAPAASPRTTAVAAIGQDAHFVFHMNFAQFKETFDGAAGLAGMFGAMPADFTLAAQVTGDFESVRYRYRAAHGEVPSNFAIAGREVPACWSVLPADAFLHGVTPIDFAAFWAQLPKILPLQPEQFGEIAGAFQEMSGVDLVNGFLPAIGPEMAMSIHRSEPGTAAPADPSAGGPPASPPIPGLIFALEMQRPDVVRKAIDGLLGAAQQSMDASAEANGATPRPIFVRTRLDATDVVTLSMPEAGMPVTPALAFHGNFLLIVSDEALIRSVLAAGAPGGRSLGTSAALERALRDLPKSGAYGFMDWNGMLDQIAEYAPMLGSLVPAPEPSDEDDAGDAPVPPDYPDNPRDRKAMEQWRNDMQAYQAAVASRGAAQVRSYIDAARLIDVIGSTSRTEGGADHAEIVIRFVK